MPFRQLHIKTMWQEASVGLVVAQAAGGLSKLAGVITGLNRIDLAIDGKAGPPFEPPFSLDLPDRPADRWFVHRDLVTTTQELFKNLTPAVTEQSQKVLLTGTAKGAADPLEEINVWARSGL